MNKVLEKPIVKSLIRGVLIAFNAVIAASETYAAQGNSVGLNLATVLGVVWTLAGVGLAIAQRYYDETDPAFGRLAKPVFVVADKVVRKKAAVKRAPKKVSEKKPGGSGTKPQQML